MILWINARTALARGRDTGKLNEQRVRAHRAMTEQKHWAWFLIVLRSNAFDECVKSAFKTSIVSVSSRRKAFSLLENIREIVHFHMTLTLLPPWWLRLHKFMMELTLVLVCILFVV